MDVNDALAALSGADPAETLKRLEADERAAFCDRVIATRSPVGRRAFRWRRRARRVAIALAASLAVGVSVAWAAGALTPLSVFEDSIQQRGVAPGSLFDQRIIPHSIERSGAVDLPNIGRVSMWTGRAAQGGWCAALRLPDRHWLGTPGDEARDGGGTAPGCYPTRKQTNDAAGQPMLVIDGFDYQENLVATLGDNAMWRIDYGRITAKHAVRVKDLISGRSSPVHNGWFIVAVLDPNAMDASQPLHLVALDRHGRIISDNCPACPGS